MTVTNNASAAPALAFSPTGLWPQVDLMPPEVRSGRKLKQTKSNADFFEQMNT